MQTAIFTTIAIALIFIGLIRGYRRGFTKLAPTVLALACGAVVGHVVGGEAADWMAGFFPEGDDPVFGPYMCTFLPAASVYVIAYFIVELVTGIIRQILGILGEGILNSLGGAIFCAFNYMTWLSLLLNLIICLDHDSAMLSTLTHDDGNLLSTVICIGPAVIGSESPAELSHDIQVREAKKISYQPPIMDNAEKNIIFVEHLQNDICYNDDSFLHSFSRNPEESISI